jgi:hypothetical protein
MLEDGNQKQLKQLGFNRIRDPYRIGTEKAQNILQVVENNGWLPGKRGFQLILLRFPNASTTLDTRFASHKVAYSGLLC